MVHANNPQNHSRCHAGLIIALVILISGVALATGPIRESSAQADARSWSYTGSLNTPRSSHTATRLSDGKVLVAGGAGGLNSAELYDPITGAWSVTGSMCPALYTPRPATGSWKQTAKLNEQRAFHTATLLSDGKVLVVEGINKWCCSVLLRSAELYDPEMLDPAPRIISASVSGKKLFITGENFHPGAVMMLNGEEQKSKNDDRNPQTTLISKKAGKKIKPGDRVQVRNPDGTLSEQLIFTGS